MTDVVPVKGNQGEEAQNGALPEGRYYLAPQTVSDSSQTVVKLFDATANVVAY